MATDKRDDPALQSQNIELRTALSDAYAAVEGQKTTQSFAAFTFEDALQQQIDRITKPTSALRPCPLDRIQKVLKGVQDSVAQLKALPDSAFAAADPDRDVNPPEEPATT
jgi:hypothetical protein